jgi:hypothetical protein
MTKSLKEAVAEVERLPEADQENIGHKRDKFPYIKKILRRDRRSNARQPIVSSHADVAQSKSHRPC